MKVNTENNETVDAKFNDDFLGDEGQLEMQPFCMIICGGAGDLSQRKLLPTLYHLYLEKKLPSQFSIIGFGMPELDDIKYREIVDEALQKFSKETYNNKDWKEFQSRLFYVGGDFENDKNYQNLSKKIDQNFYENKEGTRNLLYYMAVPPVFFPVITKKLKKFSLNEGKFNPRIIIEKPFGSNLQTAITLNDTLSTAFKENQIYRIDHYLGKETVQNIIFFRFSNSIFEPLWNRRYIDNVQITVGEDLGIEHRGAFYEKAGVIRDIIQNHMLQLVALIAMEPPVGFAPDLIRDEKVKVFKSLRTMDMETVAQNTVQGQYGPGRIAGGDVTGYRSEKNVDPKSETPSFFAGKFHIDNWRWAGVPFYVRAGKRMPMRMTQIVIQFKQPPLHLFGKRYDDLEPSYLILTIQPMESITLRYSVKYPNSQSKTYPVNMNFCYQDQFRTKSYPAYSRLLLDCMKGDFTLFVRQDGIKAMWQYIDPIINQWEKSTCPLFPNYEAGTWGPKTADELLEKDGRKWLEDVGIACAI